MKKDFIVRRSITMIDGKPHVETYWEKELVRCEDCALRFTDKCVLHDQAFPVYKGNNWFCADGEK